MKHSWVWYWFSFFFFIAGVLLGIKEEKGFDDWFFSGLWFIASAVIAWVGLKIQLAYNKKKAYYRELRIAHRKSLGEHLYDDW